MPHLPTPMGQARVSSKENYLEEKRIQTRDHRSIKGIKFSDRHKTLANKACGSDERLTFATTYTPHIPTYRLRKLLVKHWHLIEKSPLLSRLFPNRPSVTFRTHRNIRKQLTRARLEDSKIVHKIDRDLNLLCEPLPGPSATPLIRWGVVGTKTCGHAMIRKGTPLKTSNFLSIFPNERAAYFVIIAPPI